jgi:hypothetical protein
MRQATVLAADRLNGRGQAPVAGEGPPQDQAPVLTDQGKNPPDRQQTTPHRQRTPKRSTAKGEAQDKIVAALTEHHQYAGGGCLNTEPIGVNELKERYDVSKASASRFFKKEFGSHAKYRNVYCRDDRYLLAALKKLNDEYTVDQLFGGAPTQHSKDDEE